MGEWADVVWFVIWAVVILVAVGLAIWATVAAVALSSFKKAEKEMSKGFDSDFFKNARRR